MIYPEFLKENDLIGITAPSAGVGHKIESFEKSLNTIKNNGFRIIETQNVRVNNYVSSSAEERVNQLKELINNDEVKLIACATGGDFLIEILPLLNLEEIIRKPKWIMGYSDPTNLLHFITTKYDIATIYGRSAGSYDQNILHKSLEDNLQILKGNIVEQKSFELYEKERNEEIDGYNLTEKVYWENLNGEFNEQGRIIGGCLDCLRFIFGTKYDYTLQFIEKYKEDGIIWYFDVFSMSSEDVYGTLFQMKELGWFKYTKGIIFGRVLFPSEFSLSYQECIKRAFKDIPIIFNADIGHISPKMTIINGAIAKIECKDGKGKINFELR